MGESRKRFFVRAKVSARGKAEEIFPGCCFVECGRTEDCGFLTAEMSEKEFREKSGALGDGLLSRIRLA